MTHHHPPPPIGATVLGYPRIGPGRELKRALEAHWAGSSGPGDLEGAIAGIRRDAWSTMAAAGLDTVPVNVFGRYDHVLDTTAMLGAVPARFATAGPASTCTDDQYFAMARGTTQVPPLEMTKWFDTNYHHLVPEIGPGTPLVLDSSRLLAEIDDAVAAGVVPRPVVVGPWTYLALAKGSDDAPPGYDPFQRMDDLVAVYAELLEALYAAGAGWVQLDEPALVRDLAGDQPAQVEQVYGALSGVQRRPAILVVTCFGDPVEALPALAATGVDGIGLDLTRGTDPEAVRAVPGIADKALVLGAVDGRNVWRADLRAVAAELERWGEVGRTRSVATSCSLLHVPHDVTREHGLDITLRQTLAFADQKLDEVVALQRLLSGARADDQLEASDEAGRLRSSVPGLALAEVAERVGAVDALLRVRVPARPERAEAQRTRLALPPLPTTTIGSFPQTTRVRQVRAAHRAGTIDRATYVERMQLEIREVVELQESVGLDVLVHGEPERNDMVQYFAEQLDGFAASRHGWVQSYGSRCVRPPILFGDVRRPAPMTVRWTTYAQSLTTRPVKGMLTGPVTMLAWSFVRDDRPRSRTADQVALALRDELADLEAAGTAVVQVDEPALRETLPLRRAEQVEYLGWAVEAFRLATSGVRADTQVHTHLCYSEFGEVVGAIDALDADVTSIEAARSRMDLLPVLQREGFAGAVGPGVYDIHSPRVPARGELSELIGLALRSVPSERLWINPDCGLKTRGAAEVEASLRHLVQAASDARLDLDG